jgi:UMF1 family MFS transporter
LELRSSFERIAVVLNTKKAILVSLLIWTGIVVYAYGFLQTVAQAWIVGAILAMVLGGLQALSRSLFFQMIPGRHRPRSSASTK